MVGPSGNAGPEARVLFNTTTQSLLSYLIGSPNNAE
jgi:hypothetical protein